MATFRGGGDPLQRRNTRLIPVTRVAATTKAFLWAVFDINEIQRRTYTGACGTRGRSRAGSPPPHADTCTRLISAHHSRFTMNKRLLVQRITR